MITNPSQAIADAIELLRQYEYVDTSGDEYRSQCVSCEAKGPDYVYPLLGREPSRYGPKLGKPTLVPAEPHKPDCEWIAVMKELGAL